MTLHEISFTISAYPISLSQRLTLALTALSLDSDVTRIMSGEVKNVLQLPTYLSFMHTNSGRERIICILSLTYEFCYKQLFEASSVDVPEFAVIYLRLTLKSSSPPL